MSKAIRKVPRIMIVMISALFLTCTNPSFTGASSSNVIVSLPISAGTVTISAPASFGFSSISVAFDAQLITNDFTGTDNRFIISDLKGHDSGYTTTLQLTGDLVSTGGSSISSGNVYFRSLGPTGFLLSGTANPRVIIDSAATGGYQPLNNTRNFIYRDEALNTGVLSAYYQNISMQISVPASQAAGNYVGTLVYTLIEN